jgi:hypothetical protein
MTRKLGSIGLLVLVIAMAVVLVLVAKSWTAVAPTATEIRAGTAASGDDAAGDDDMPGMSDMKRETDAHADDVREAMAAID